MSFTIGFELDVDADLAPELAEATYARGAAGRIFADGTFELDADTDLAPDFASSGYVRGAAGRVFAPLAFELLFEDLEIDLAAGGYANPVSRARLGTFSPGFGIEFDAIQYLPADTGIELFFGEVAPPTIRLSRVIEVLFPTKPVAQSNRVLFQVGTEEWRVAKDAAATTTQVTSTIRFRIDTDYLPTFLGDLDAGRSSAIRLNLPGYTPFGVNSSDNYVRVLSRGRPKREEGGLTYVLDVTFLFVGAYP